MRVEKSGEANRQRSQFCRLQKAVEALFRGVVPVTERSFFPGRYQRGPRQTIAIQGPHATQFRRPPDGADILLERSRSMQESGPSVAGAGSLPRKT